MLHCDLHYHPFEKLTVQQLSERDKARPLWFCNQFVDLGR
jgi:hypothetical protein